MGEMEEHGETAKRYITTFGNVFYFHTFMLSFNIIFASQCHTVICLIRMQARRMGCDWL
jgi:hypothetical protein